MLEDVCAESLSFGHLRSVLGRSIGNRPGLHVDALLQTDRASLGLLESDVLAGEVLETTWKPDEPP